MSRYIGIMYKIKKCLPLTARLQIYHSFVQSHVHYCSVVWGFSNKSNLEKIFAKQKMGLRAIIPGFINYSYKDGKIPGHTKSKFKEYSILSIHNVVAFNTLIFMQKIHNYPSLLPQSIKDTIRIDSPVHGSSYESCGNWMNTYNNAHYSKSIFFKGPLLSFGTKITELLPLTSFLSIKLYKTNVKQALLTIQGSGDSCEWQNDNFMLYNVEGLRRSKVSYRVNIDYSNF